MLVRLTPVWILIALPFAKGFEVALDLAAFLVDRGLRGREHLESDHHKRDLHIQLVRLIQDLNL